MNPTEMGMGEKNLVEDESMVSQIGKTFIDKALLDPGAIFRRPADVLDHPELTRDTKLEILRRWELDARELMIAEEEGMIGGEESLLSDIVSAIHSLENNC